MEDYKLQGIIAGLKDIIFDLLHEKRDLISSNESWKRLCAEKEQIIKGQNAEIARMKEQSVCHCKVED